jgi:hypothetical protein
LCSVYYFCSIKYEIIYIKGLIIKPIEKGQIVKFHTPLQEENPNQLFVVLEVTADDERPRADIQALNTG